MGFNHVELMVMGNFDKTFPPLRPPAGQHYERWFFSREENDEAFGLWKTEFDDKNQTPKTWHSKLPSAWHSSEWVGNQTIDWLKNYFRFNIKCF